LLGFQSAAREKDLPQMKNHARGQARHYRCFALSNLFNLRNLLMNFWLLAERQRGVKKVPPNPLQGILTPPESPSS
jgi:hypothetical protein